VDMDETMEVPLRIGGYETMWGDLEEKRCRECGKLGHILSECEIHQENLKTRAHIRAVKEYQKGGPLRIIPQRSYAQMAKGKGPSDTESNGMTGQQQQQQEQRQQQQQEQRQQKQQEQRQQQQQQKKSEDNRNVQQETVNKQHNGMEKKINTLNETIIRMQEEQLQVSQMNCVLMSIVIQMFSQQMGITIPKELLLAAGLSTEVNRNAMKSKKGTSAMTQNIPSTNDSLGMMMDIITQMSASQAKRHPIPIVTTNGQQPNTTPK
ncbi:hypothetical protein BGX26_005859, partial [Mortierella sp. AD094]